ncbi:hypoxanthine phosphoribosyltransferase [Lactobacillus sp. DCY120]|uniref:Hypoxanthine phosphoribosyltransferase n=1 Tax=Bombilactobacillus apium TaxID=2675299 RepID=A0A850RAB9_9LACO|nr:hypoxanthine phosphoribosyltransferase [Bombilactobacillus apium]NVY96306.1 hypoxanthine phosphoribosyltransferase [Bombilactobacillus apium]
MNQDIQRVLYTAEDLAAANQRLGRQLAQDYAGKQPIFVCILKGAVVFLTDLMRQIPTELSVDFMDVSSYNGQTSSSGAVKILKDLDVSVAGRDVIFVEDIVDTGITLQALMELFKTRKVKSMKLVAMLDKKMHRQREVQPDYVGLECPDEFIVGYGMDYQDKYRNLPYIGILKPDVYK